jgi:triosephosphate isomerase
VTPQRRPVFAANWKMNKTHFEAIRFVEELRNRLDPDDYERSEVVICPPFTSIRSVQTTIDGDDLPLLLGAQNVFWEDSGAYTGEISPAMLSKLGVRYVIIGHSERREYFGETDDDVNKKVRAAYRHELRPIMCVGETLEEREAGETETKVSAQVRAGVKGVSMEQLESLVVAYEPIWAIGTGRNASPEDAQTTIAMIRQTLFETGKGAEKSVRIQYGGSVKPGNIGSFMDQPDIDGALVGGASLAADDFAMIVRYYKG